MNFKASHLNWYRHLSDSGLVHLLKQDILAYNCEDPASSSLPFPIIADCKRELAVALGMLDPDEKDKDGMPLTARCVSLHNKNLTLSFKGLSILSILMPTESDYYPSQTPPLRLSVCLCGCVFRCLSSGPTKGSNCRSSTRPPPDATLTRSCEWWTPSSSQLGNEWPHLPTGRYVTCWRQSSSIETWTDLLPRRITLFSFQPGECVMVPPSMSEEEAASLFPTGIYTKELPSGKKYLRYTPKP